MEEVNLLEYIFICPYCKKKITAYNDDPSLDYNQGSFEKQINFDYNKEIWYDSTKHNNEQISLSIDELIEKLHNYDVPEMIVIDSKILNNGYSDWFVENS